MSPASAAPPLLVLVNPGAREGRAAARLRALLARAPDLAARAVTIAVASVADAARALAAAPAAAIAVAAGGDGTANLVARALRETDPTRSLALLPLGTGNAIAHSFGLHSPAAALAALATGTARPLDVLATTHPNTPLALCSLSAGFEADLLRGLAHRRGVFRAPGLICALPRALRRRRGIALRVDGIPLALEDERVFNAGIYNLRCYAFGRVVHPDAEGGDGRVDVVVHPDARSWLAALARGQATAAPGAGPARTGRGARVTLEVDGPIQVDGEAAPGGAFEVRVERAALRLIVPDVAPPALPSVPSVE